MRNRTPLIWIGPRSSEISEIESIFSEAITLFADERLSIATRSLEAETGIRVDHNSEEGMVKGRQFFGKNIHQILKQNKNARFLWYSLEGEDIPDWISASSPYNNPIISRYLSNKTRTRRLVSRHMHIAPIYGNDKKSQSYEEAAKIVGSDELILQAPYGAGGHQTFLVSCKDDFDRALKSLGDDLLISAYIKDAIALNQHVVISGSRVLPLPFSLQVIERNNFNQLIYRGADFSVGNLLGKNIRARISEKTRMIGQLMAGLGYVGAAGIDYLLKDDRLYFVEINPRFQASTSLLNKTLLDWIGSSVHELHMDAYRNDLRVDLDDIVAKGSFISITKYDETNAGNASHSPQGAMSIKPPDTSHLIAYEGLELTRNIISADQYSRADTGALVGSIVVSQPFFGISTTGSVQKNMLYTNLLESVSAKQDKLQALIASRAYLKFALLAQGVRIDASTYSFLRSSFRLLTTRDGGAGGIGLFLNDAMHVNAPIKETYSLLSPFKLSARSSGLFAVTYNGSEVATAKILSPKRYFAKTAHKNKHSGEGPMIADILTDRMNIYPFSGCRYSMSNGLGCGFCEIALLGKVEKNLAKEVAQILADNRSDDASGLRHFLVGGGTPQDRDQGHFLEVVNTIRESSDLPIYAMISPPANLSYLDALFQAGVTEVGFNLEIFDREIARTIMPGKGKIPLKRYMSAFRHARTLWKGRHEVRSILIAGLEPVASTLSGVEALASNNVMPIIEPFRPIPGTNLEHVPQQSPEQLLSLWETASRIASEHGQIIGPDCPGCQNNTLAFSC